MAMGCSPLHGPLVDGDLASNSHGWQWAAGTGTDAAPYFRVFNPVTQSQRFDPSGAYIRRWVPELSSLGDREIHAVASRNGPPLGYPAADGRPCGRTGRSVAPIRLVTPTRRGPGTR